MKAIEIAPSPNATGAPDNSMTSVTIRTSRPCVVGLKRCSLVTLRRDAEGALTPGDEREQVGEALQREDSEPDRHRGVGNPQTRAPHRVGDPLLVPCLLPELKGEHRDCHAEDERKAGGKERESPAPTRAEIVREHVDVHV